QRAMGWTDSHLHHFFAAGTFYGAPDPDVMADFGPSTLNEKHYTVADLASANESFLYEYDFGDCWNHKIAVEKILPADPDFKYPVCLAGANADPTEDCGGIPGYYELIEVLADSGHPRYNEMKEWLGYDFDPHRFDLEATNGVLSRLKA